MQLNRYLALCGVASRRKANDIIKGGRVRVNGVRVDTLGISINPDNDSVVLDGTSLEIQTGYRYVLLNKPADVLSTTSDERGRKTVYDLVPSKERLFSVGRLDMDTLGVLLLTNDGDLAHRLMHPSFEIDKIYHAWVRGRIDSNIVEKLDKGIDIGEGVVVRAESEIMRILKNKSRIALTIHEGRKHQVKRMLNALGHPVVHLERVCFAGLEIKNLPRGAWRDLNSDEVKKLYELTGLQLEQRSMN